MSRNIFEPSDSLVKAKPNQFRFGKRTEKYEFTVKDHKQKSHTYEAKYEFWKDLRVGEKLPAKKSLIFGTYKGLDKKLDIR